MSKLNFSDLRVANLDRNDEGFPPINDWSPAEWACAMAGECSEVCNAVVKLMRVYDSTNTEKDPQTIQEARQAIADELGDLITYADLLAARLGIDLSMAVKRKFNAVSKRINSTVTL